MERKESSARIGVISDTHGLLRAAALDALQGCSHILHAGDVGDAEILEALSQLAPVTAVRGNVDRGTWAEALPLTQAVQIGEIWIYMLHDVQVLDIDPTAAGFAAVISGHSHQPSIENKKGVLYLNPGSAGPRRFRLPIGLAFLTVRDRQVQAKWIELEG